MDPRGALRGTDRMTIHSTLAATALGWTAGMRSMTAPALLARALPRASGSLLSRPTVRAGLAVAALGEMAADKHPAIPSRTSPPALIGRLGSGLLVGATIASARGDSRLAGALIGGAAAVASSFAMERLRAEAGRQSGAPDAVVAVGEDALAVALGSAGASAVR